MLAATLGARAGGGKVTGVTLYPKDMKNFEGKAKDNILDEEIKTTSYVERTLTLMREGQVYVVFNGGTGTVSEFAMAWGLARLYFGHHKPLILYGKFWKKIIKAFQDNMHMRKEEGKVFKIVDSPEEVLEAIKQFEDEIARGEHDHHVRTTRKDSLNYMN
jgi:predicted Rossmann-fold nucleotide-binding protein